MSKYYVSPTLRLYGFMNVKTTMENTFGADVNKGSPITETYKTTTITTNRSSTYNNYVSTFNHYLCPI